MKTKEELKTLKEEYESVVGKLKELTEEELEKVTGGEAEVNGDVGSLKVTGKSVPLPPAKSKKLIDGGYDGNTDTIDS